MAAVLFPALFPIAFVNMAREDAPAEQVVPVLLVLVLVALAVFVHPVAGAGFSGPLSTSRAATPSGSARP